MSVEFVRRYCLALPHATEAGREAGSPPCPLSEPCALGRAGG